MEPTKAPWDVDASAPTLSPPKPGLRRKSADLGLSISSHPAMPPSTTSSTFIKPVRRVTNEEELNSVLLSPAVRSFLCFVQSLNHAATGTTLSQECMLSAGAESLLECLHQLGQWVDEIPPQSHTHRYGNPAFRTWCGRLEDAAPRLVESMLDAAGVTQLAGVELVGYFVESFGNKSRIDYGTGHETTFVAFLYCLARLGVLSETDCKGIVLKVFNSYLHLMRKLQTTYWLEPAGSHGVWGLEDYQFLPFLWGSAQLINHPLVRPKSIHNEDILRSYADEYLYLESVMAVKKVKKGPLWETSPYLSDIAAVPNWSKVNSGLFKMYRAEVLGKLPIMQHFLFGSLIPFLDEV